MPEYELDGWTTTLPCSMTSQQIIDRYADHGTHEQFQSEFKTDLDLMRLPSGKFETNALVCHLAALAMNILRQMGQRGLLGTLCSRAASHQDVRSLIPLLVTWLIEPLPA